VNCIFGADRRQGGGLTQSSSSRIITSDSYSENARTGARGIVDLGKKRPDELQWSIRMLTRTRKRTSLGKKRVNEEVSDYATRSETSQKHCLVNHGAPFVRTSTWARRKRGGDRTN